MGSVYLTKQLVDLVDEGLIGLVDGDRFQGHGVHDVGVAGGVRRGDGRHEVVVERVLVGVDLTKAQRRQLAPLRRNVLAHQFVQDRRHVGRRLFQLAPLARVVQRQKVLHYLQAKSNP